jgi:FkbM family methyltransferase
MISQTKNIYNKLADEESKKIFINRLLFSLTDDYRFISNIVFESQKNLKCLLEESNELIIYGAGKFPQLLIRHLDALGIKITAFCDKNEEKQKNPYFGYTVISPQELKEKHGNAFIIISVVRASSVAEINDSLINAGFNKENIGIFKTTLSDSEYFESGLIIPGEDEVFIDAGSFNFNTSFQFIKWCNNSYKKIIAFEPHPEQYQKCIETSMNIKNIEIFPHGLWNESGEVSFDTNPALGTQGSRIACDKKEQHIIKIKTVSLDDVLKDEKATFIKMDIEGAELNALKGAKNTIIKYRPKLAICLYHKLEDIWEIPTYIMQLCDDYKFYIRHYNSWHSGTILYAI